MPVQGNVGALARLTACPASAVNSLSGLLGSLGQSSARDDAPSRPPLDVRLALPGSGRVEILDRAAVDQRPRRGPRPRGRAGWLVLVAEHQTAGRGRLDRTWETPHGAALTFSVLLRPEVPAERWPWLPLLTGYAVGRRCVRPGRRPALKWPNDVLVHGQKIAGILRRAGRDPGWAGGGPRHRPQRLDHGRGAAGATATSLALPRSRRRPHDAAERAPRRAGCASTTRGVAGESLAPATTRVRVRRSAATSASTCRRGDAHRHGDRHRPRRTAARGVRRPVSGRAPGTSFTSVASDTRSDRLRRGHLTKLLTDGETCRRRHAHAPQGADPADRRPGRPARGGDLPRPQDRQRHREPRLLDRRAARVPVVRAPPVPRLADRDVHDHHQAADHPRGSDRPAGRTTSR